MPDETARSPAVAEPPAVRTRPPARVHAVDFSRPSKFAKDQERRLSSAHETFCRTAATRLSSELRAPVDLQVRDHRQLTWTSAANEMPAGSVAAVLEMRPIDRRMLLATEHGFLLALIERLLGGDVEPAPEPRRLSDVDLALTRQILGRLVEQLSIVWQDLAEVEVALAGLEPDPESAALASLSEPTWLLEIEARVGRSSFLLMLALPYRSFEPVQERLPRGGYDGGEASDAAATALALSAIGEAEIELRAEVGATELTVDDVLAFEVGDVVRLDSRDRHGVTVYAGDVPVHRARPGRSARRRAVQVLGQAGHDR